MLFQLAKELRGAGLSDIPDYQMLPIQTSVFTGNLFFVLCFSSWLNKFMEEMY
jgi:hypothetical protein